MRYAIFSDIHGNLDAFEAVLEGLEAESVDTYVCLGDIVGYGPQPSECLQTVRKYNCITIAGNHDFAVAVKLNISTFNPLARAATLWTRNQMPESDLSYLAQLPLVEELDQGHIVHGTLYSPELFDYIQTSYDAHLAMTRMELPVCFIGHSHIPVNFIQGEIISYSFDQEIPVPPDCKLIVNVGSVGQPRDQDPRACCAVYDSDEATVSIKRFTYDVDTVVTKIQQAGLPEALGERLRVGR